MYENAEAYDEPIAALMVKWVRATRQVVILTAANIFYIGLTAVILMQYAWYTVLEKSVPDIFGVKAWFIGAVAFYCYCWTNRFCKMAKDLVTSYYTEIKDLRERQSSQRLVDDGFLTKEQRAANYRFAGKLP